MEQTMKKHYLLFITLLCTLAANAQQSKRDSLRNSYTQEFLVSPLSFFVGGFEVGYGFTTQKTNTKFLAGYYYSENAGSYFDDGITEFSNMEGFRVEAQRLFIKPVNGGLRYYAGGYAVYKTIRMDKQVRSNDVQKLTGSALGFGLILGARTFAGDNFFFDLFIGGGPNISLDGSNDDDVHIPIVNPYKRGIVPRAGLTFGIAF